MADSAGAAVTWDTCSNSLYYLRTRNAVDVPRDTTGLVANGVHFIRFNTINEMSVKVPSRGLFNASNIPFDLQVKIGQQIEPYTIVPLLDGEVRGSGTLVKIDGVHGILTAAHVVRNWEDSRAKTSRDWVRDK